MSADLAIGVKVGFSAGAAIAGLGSVRKSMVALQTETQRFSARQRMLGNVLSDPLRMSKERVGELKREYVQLGITIDKLRSKSTQLGTIQLRRQNLAGQRQDRSGLDIPGILVDRVIERLLGTALVGLMERHVVPVIPLGEPGRPAAGAVGTGSFHRFDCNYGRCPR